MNNWSSRGTIAKTSVPKVIYYQHLTFVALVYILHPCSSLRVSSSSFIIRPLPSFILFFLYYHVRQHASSHLPPLASSSTFLVHTRLSYIYNSLTFTLVVRSSSLPRSSVALHLGWLAPGFAEFPQRLPHFSIEVILSTRQLTNSLTPQSFDWMILVQNHELRHSNPLFQVFFLKI